jgi:predicted nuclease with TOPRIM domain
MTIAGRTEMASVDGFELAPEVAVLFDRELGRLEGELEEVRNELQQLEGEIQQVVCELARERFEEYH